MRRLALLLIVVTVFLFNYRILTFDGFVQTNHTSTYSEILANVVDDINITYYKKPLKRQDSEYIIITEVQSGRYLEYATSDEITAIKLLANIAPNLTVTEAKPIHLIVYCVLFLIILLLPTKKQCQTN